MQNFANEQLKEVMPAELSEYTDNPEHRTPLPTPIAWDCPQKRDLVLSPQK